MNETQVTNNNFFFKKTGFQVTLKRLISLKSVRSYFYLHGSVRSFTNEFNQKNKFE